MSITVEFTEQPKERVMWFQTIDPVVSHSSPGDIFQIEWTFVPNSMSIMARAGLLFNCFIYLIYIKFCLNKMPLSFTGI